MNARYQTDWVAAACGPLSVRMAQEPAEVQLLRDALNCGHSLKAGRPAGHVLWQGVYERDPECGIEQLVAVLCWGGAAMRLKDRDAWLGWDPVTCANRLALVVQLRRFMVVEAARRPNLASRCMGLALREVRGQWHAAHGFLPLLAESFSDPESHHGTVYKVTNWQPLGFTAGFARHRADFYTDEDKPKKLWVMELARNARALLGSPAELPAGCLPGVANGVAGARCALKCPQLKTLARALHAVPDPRSKCSRRHPIGAMLSLVSLGLLGGAADVKACWNHTGPLNPSQRAAIGLRKRDGSGRLTHPSYDSFRDILAAVDPEVLAATLSAWLCANEGLLPRSLAFDGKAIGALKGGIITLCHHATGAPVAMAIHRGAKDDCEMPDARRLIDAVQPSLAGAILTADSLHCQKKTARVIVGRGGDYILGLTENQPNLRAEAARLLQQAPPLCPPQPKKPTDALTCAS